MLSVLHSQYHACWCSGDLSHSIGRYGIDPGYWPPKLEYSVFSIRRVKIMTLLTKIHVCVITLIWVHLQLLTPLVLDRCGYNFTTVFFKLIFQINNLISSCYRWMPMNPIDESTLVQVMVWCCQATSHYLSQCWPRSMWSYDITRPPWVNLVFFDP